MPPGCDDSTGFEPLALSYAEAIAQAQQALRFGIRPSLDGICELAAALGEPEARFASVQVAGTNGKTSVTWMTATLLEAHGRRTGAYTSPHLERYNERIRVGGQPLPDERFAAALGAALAAARCVRGADALGTPSGFTEFELLTAAALWEFAEAGVEVAVLEVGLGGRWDATSVVSPSVAVITGVGLDHTALLGDSIEKIAAEKAQVIRSASAPVLGPGTAGIEEPFLARATECATHPRAVRAFGEPTPVAEELTVRFELLQRPDAPGAATRLSVRGVHADYGELALSAPAYQAANAATAIAAAEAALGRALDAAAVREALRAVALPGRFELVRAEPPAIVDGAHNPQAARTMAGAIADAWPLPARRPMVLLGVLADKDARGIAEAIAPVASEIAVTAPESPRALPAGELAAVVEQVTGAAPRTFATVADALEVLLGEAEDGLVVTGSLVTAGEARGLLRDRSATA